VLGVRRQPAGCRARTEVSAVIPLFFLVVGLILGVIIGVALMYAKPPVVLDHEARSAREVVGAGHRR
jgi:hypothetical protein